MKSKLIPFVTLSFAAAFAAAPAFSHPLPLKGTAFASLQDQQEEKPPEKPPAKPPKPQQPDDPKPPAKPPKPDNPPAHQPDNKPAEKRAKPPKNPPQQENPSSQPANTEKPPKPEKPPKQEKQEKPAKNSETNQNKKSVHAQANPHYSFRSQDKTTLKQHFDVQIRSVDRSNRPHIRVGGFISAESVTYIEPVPVEVITLLPPIPDGCVVGFWDGFIIVYYPDDFYIVSYIDLL
jgi:outer membrane biosynthesis protein TonB